VGGNEEKEIFFFLFCLLFILKTNVSNGGKCATAPAITDILLADAFNSPNNLTYRDRFVTIFDQITEPVDAGGPNERSMTCYKKLNLETLWNAGTDALIGSIASGSMYLFVAQSGSIATNAPSVTIRSRVRYTDN